MTFKQKVYQHYREVLNERIKSLQKVLNDLTDSAGNETKSTAGDKHETALAMLQIEQENTARQLKEALLQKSTLEKINPALATVSIVQGSLVKTNKGYLFVSIALGKLKVDDVNVIALSPQSPLGAKLLGLTVSDTAEANGTQYVIEDIA